jgi:HSP20 family protein
MLVRWDPFRDVRSVDREFDRLIGRTFGKESWFPALDVREAEDRFEVTMDLPGLEPDDVTITFEDRILTIKGQREHSSEDEGETYHRVERSYGSFAQSVRMPVAANGEQAEASFDKGVLTVTVPKVEAAKPRTIEVTAK